jgi:polar amino acid transport system substrate-binding protein
MKLLSQILMLSLLLLGCDQKKPEQTLTVATSADNPPYEFIRNGEIVGMDIDIINAIGERIGRKVTIKNLDFYGLIASLASKNVDLVIAALSITEERKNVVDFSNHYMISTVSVLYRAPDNFNHFNDLKNRIVGAQIGSTWESIAKQLSQDLNFKINSSVSNLMLVQELRANVVDAVILEEEQCKGFIHNYPALASFNMPEEFASKFAIALQKDSTLTNEINAAISELQASGKLDLIKRKWLTENEDK